MSTKPLDMLYDYQSRALAVMEQIGDLLDGHPADMQAAVPTIRAEMTTLLRNYQIFKHEQIFDPAVATGDAECMKLGRAMKIECIAAGEAFRVHTQKWKAEAIAADWGNYRVATRLTMHGLRRHLERERDGIERLIGMLQTRDRCAA